MYTGDMIEFIPLILMSHEYKKKESRFSKTQKKLCPLASSYVMRVTEKKKE